MTLLRGYKMELDPTCKQVRQLRQHAGAARWAYNWGLRRKQEVYKETGKSPDAMELHKELVLLKNLPVEEGGVPWMYESSKCAPQEALRALDVAFSNFFSRCKQGAKRKGFPRFKSRKNGIGKFKLTGTIRILGSRVQLPNLGKIRLKQQGYIPTFGVRIIGATVSEASGHWFVSLQVEEDPLVTVKSYHVVGIDVGIKHLAVTSDGVVYENPKALIRAQKQLRLRQKAVSRKKKGSSNRKKAAAKLAKLHFRISNIRKDSIHKMTTAIVKQASTIVIESLNIAGMIRNPKVARALSDAALGEVHRQLVYKSKWRGVELLKADRFFPSTKKCSGCGAEREISLSERTYTCDACGLTIDRDLNAALNLKSLAGSSLVTAYRPDSSGSEKSERNCRLGRNRKRKEAVL